MSSKIVEMVKDIKEVHPYVVVFIKQGSFYNCYGKDTYIIAGLKDYKIRYIDDVPYCGFNKQNLNSNIALMEQKKLSYMIVDKRNNYEVLEKVERNEENEYLKIFEENKKKLNKEARIGKVVENIKSLEEEKYKDVIAKIEDILHENRAI